MTHPLFANRSDISSGHLQGKSGSKSAFRKNSYRILLAIVMALTASGCGRQRKPVTLEAPPLPRQNAKASEPIWAYFLEEKKQADASNKNAPSDYPLSHESLPPIPMPPDSYVSNDNKSHVYGEFGPPILSLGPTPSYNRYYLTIDGEAIPFQSLADHLATRARYMTLGFRRLIMWIHPDTPLQVLTLVGEQVHIASEKAKRETRANPEFSGVDGGDIRCVVPSGQTLQGGRYGLPMTLKFIQVAPESLNTFGRIQDMPLPVGTHFPKNFQPEAKKSYPCFVLNRSSKNQELSLTLGGTRFEPAQTKASPIKNLLKRITGSPARPALNRVINGEPLETQAKQQVEHLRKPRIFVAADRDLSFGSLQTLLSMGTRIEADETILLVQTGQIKRSLSEFQGDPPPKRPRP